MSSWALGSSTTASQRREEPLTSTHTHVPRLSMHQQAVHTNIHKHADPLDSTQTHFPKLPQETDAAMFTASPETLTGKSERPAPIFPLSPKLAFLSDISASTLESVYLSKTTTLQVLLLLKSKSGGGVGDKFPDEHASRHTQENVNRAWSTRDNKQEMCCSCEACTPNVFVFTLKDTEESGWSCSQKNTPEASKHRRLLCLSLERHLVPAPPSGLIH